MASITGNISASSGFISAFRSYVTHVSQVDVVCVYVPVFDNLSLIISSRIYLYIIDK